MRLQRGHKFTRAGAGSLTGTTPRDAPSDAMPERWSRERCPTESVDARDDSWAAGGVTGP